MVSDFINLHPYTADQRCHLQALRHLYALAARPRLLEAVDAATHKPIYAPLEITTRKMHPQTEGASVAAEHDGEEQTVKLGIVSLHVIHSYNRE